MEQTQSITKALRVIETGLTCRIYNQESGDSQYCHG